MYFDPTDFGSIYLVFSFLASPVYASLHTPIHSFATDFPFPLCCVATGLVSGLFSILFPYDGALCQVGGPTFPFNPTLFRVYA